MPAQIIDGTSTSSSIREVLKMEVAELKAKHGKVPGVAAVIVGAQADSERYVHHKHRAANDCGFESLIMSLPMDVTQNYLEASIEELNANPKFHGIIIQLPLPDHLHERQAIEKVSRSKDVDGLLTCHIGLLHAKGCETPFPPCTAAGIIELLTCSGVKLEGARAVVLGRSNIVGTPVAAMLMQRNATVTVVHTSTPPSEVPLIVREADVVISAMGIPESVRGGWIKPGAAVIDVGTTPVEDSTRPSGFRLCGDVCFHEVSEKAAFISPVPGGVGPMTITMLLKNTLNSFKMSLSE